MFISVDLPLPLGPMMARYSLRRICKRHTAQRVHGFLAHHVFLGDVLDVDHDRAGQPDLDSWNQIRVSSESLTSSSRLVHDSDFTSLPCP